MAAPTTTLSTQHSALSTRLGWLRNRLVVRILLWLLLLYFLLPIVWTVSSSFKNRQELFQGTPSLITLQPSLANYQHALQRFRDFDTYYRNSLIVTLGAVAVQTTLATLAGYGFARVRFKGRDLIFYSMILLIFVPRAGGLMAQYELMHFLNLRNNLIGLILAFSAGLSVPIFIMRQAFLSIPKEIEEAAIVDGASWFNVYWRIALPLSWPILVTLAIMHLVGSYNDFIWPLLTISDPSIQVVTVGLTQFTTEFGIVNWGPRMAAYAISSLPLVVLFTFGMRYYVRGLTSGALKG